MRRRLAEMGGVASGLVGFYEHRLAIKNLLGTHESAVSFVTAHIREWTRLYDIGAGIGTIGAAIAVEGLPVVAVEREPARFATMETICAAVRAHFPGTRIEARSDSFPDGFDPAGAERQIALALTMSGQGSAEFYAAFEQALSRFDTAIVQFGSLFTGGSTPADERDGEKRAASFCARHNLPKPIRLRAYAAHIVGRGSQRFHDAA